MAGADVQISVASDFVGFNEGTFNLQIATDFVVPSIDTRQPSLVGREEGANLRGVVHLFWFPLDSKPSTALCVFKKTLKFNAFVFFLLALKGREGDNKTWRTQQPRKVSSPGHRQNPSWQVEPAGKGGRVHCKYSLFAFSAYLKRYASSVFAF